MLMSVNVEPYLGAVLAIALGVYSFRQGFLILRYGRKIVPPPAKVGIWLIRILKGPEEARKKEDEITSSEKLRTTGINALFVGFILLLGGMLRIIGIIMAF